MNEENPQQPQSAIQRMIAAHAQALAAVARSQEAQAEFVGNLVEQLTSSQQAGVGLQAEVARQRAELTKDPKVLVLDPYAKVPGDLSDYDLVLVIKENVDEALESVDVRHSTLPQIKTGASWSVRN